MFKTIEGMMLEGGEYGDIKSWSEMLLRYHPFVSSMKETIHMANSIRLLLLMMANEKDKEAKDSSLKTITIILNELIGNVQSLSANVSQTNHWKYLSDFCAVLSQIGEVKIVSLANLCWRTLRAFWRAYCSKTNQTMNVSIPMKILWERIIDLDVISNPKNFNFYTASLQSLFTYYVLSKESFLLFEQISLDWFKKTSPTRLLNKSNLDAILDCINCACTNFCKKNSASNYLSQLRKEDPVGLFFFFLFTSEYCDPIHNIGNINKIYQWLKIDSIAALMCHNYQTQIIYFNLLKKISLILSKPSLGNSLVTHEMENFLLNGLLEIDFWSSQIALDCWIIILKQDENVSLRSRHLDLFVTMAEEISDYSLEMKVFTLMGVIAELSPQTFTKDVLLRLIPLEPRNISDARKFEMYNLLFSQFPLSFFQNSLDQMVEATTSSLQSLNNNWSNFNKESLYRIKTCRNALSIPLIDSKINPSLKRKSLQTTLSILNQSLKMGRDDFLEEVFLIWRSFTSIQEEKQQSEVIEACKGLAISTNPQLQIPIAGLFCNVEFRNTEECKKIWKIISSRLINPVAVYDIILRGTSAFSNEIKGHFDLFSLEIDEKWRKVQIDKNSINIQDMKPLEENLLRLNQILRNVVNQLNSSNPTPQDISPFQVCLDEVERINCRK
eukprot:TRINITY_DN2414_c0_g1_i1.p1 TRINITY_DN2414_c0_g1~~TRINITY_DN2414_c0_g1_i1.p1  ORF type:complete len:764 (-),score=162.40 TRINITY_DN2414_c0_g1_i1:5-2008(-)